MVKTGLDFGVSIEPPFGGDGAGVRPMDSIRYETLVNVFPVPTEHVDKYKADIKAATTVNRIPIDIVAVPGGEINAQLRDQIFQALKDAFDDITAAKEMPMIVDGITLNLFIRKVNLGLRSVSRIGMAIMGDGLYETYPDIDVKIASDTLVIFKDPQLDQDGYEKLKRKLIRLANVRLARYNAPLIPGNWDEEN